jgi:pimeloyl-ACP methyl ester carboxylesterase
MTDHIFILPNGRALAYAMYGPGDGYPVLYFHGTPSSRLEPSLVEAYGIDLYGLLVKYRLQLIAVDRPGMGLSTFDEKADFISVAHDAEHLLKSLHVQQCKVLCWSGGGPFALAFADQFSEMVEGVYIISGFTRSFSEDHVFKKMHANKLYFGAAKYLPFLIRWILSIIGKKVPKKPLPRFLSRLPAVDHRLLLDSDKLKQLVATTIKEAVRQGSKGAIKEATSYFEHLGFELKNIRQPVHFWWGTEDNAVVRLHAEAIQQEVSNGHVHYKQNEGHLSIYVRYLDEVLKTIAGRGE